MSSNNLKNNAPFRCLVNIIIYLPQLVTVKLSIQVVHLLWYKYHGNYEYTPYIYKGCDDCSLLLFTSKSEREFYRMLIQSYYSTSRCPSVVQASSQYKQWLLRRHRLLSVTTTLQTVSDAVRDLFQNQHCFKLELFNVFHLGVTRVNLHLLQAQ